MILFYFVVNSILLLALIFMFIPLHLLNARYSLRYKTAELFSYIFIYLMKYICNVKYEVYGLELLPKTRPYLALSNHQSFWENVFMQLIIPEHSWVVKKELYRIPIFGLGLLSMEPIAVDRSAYISVRQILEQGKEKLKKNISLVLFPEGTRVPVNKNVSFKPSGAKLALDCQVPIVLIVHNAGTVWPKGAWVKKFGGKITVKIIEQITVDQLKNFDTRSLNCYIEEKINTEKNLL